MSCRHPAHRRAPWARAVASAAALGAISAHATIAFQVTDLGVVPGTQTGQWNPGSYVSGINNDGSVIGTYGSALNGGEGAAFSWSPGAATPTPLPGLGFATFTGGINAAGQAVGYSFGVPADPANDHAAMWQAGQVTDLVALGLPAGADAHGINDAGQIAGTLNDGSAFVWSGGQLSKLGKLGGSWVDVAQINNAGQIAGTLETQANGIPGAGRSAFVRQVDGTLTMLAGLPGDSTSFAFGLNNLGQVVGASNYGPVLWTPGLAAVSLTSFVLPGSNQYYLQTAQAINDLGQIAGSISSGGSNQVRGGVLTPTGTLEWTGSHGSAFSDGLNWDSGLGYAPSALLDVLIAPANPATVLAGTNAQARSLALGRIDANTGWRIGQGTLVVAGGSTLVVSQAVTLISGQLDIEAGAALHAGALTQTGGTLTVDGSLDTYGGDVSITEGTLNGNGSINAASFTVGGGPGFAFFRPGHSPGRFTVNAALTMAANSELELQVEREPDGSLAWDHVSASSISFLAGSSVHFIVGTGVAADVALNLAFLDCGSGCSFGAGVNFVVDGAPGATVSFGAAGLVLSIAPAQPVPEPASAALWLAGLMAGAGLSRRQRRFAGRPAPGPATGG